MPVSGAASPKSAVKMPTPHRKQLRQLLLIPSHGLGVAEVYDSVVHRRFAVGAQDGVALLDGFLVQLVLRVEVR
jgi:hypothetical protein